VIGILRTSQPSISMPGHCVCHKPGTTRTHPHCTLHTILVNTPRAHSSPRVPPATTFTRRRIRYVALLTPPYPLPGVQISFMTYGKFVFMMSTQRCSSGWIGAAAMPHAGSSCGGAATQSPRTLRTRRLLSPSTGRRPADSPHRLRSNFSLDVSLDRHGIRRRTVA
jgi:hypothetical protein